MLGAIFIFVVVGISIHALCEEGDREAVDRVHPQHYFYPRPLRGGRPIGLNTSKPVQTFLSTPSARRTTPAPQAGSDTEIFLSTPSARRATFTALCSRRSSAISIHALCEEGDQNF